MTSAIGRSVSWITAFTVRRALAGGKWLTSPALAEKLTHEKATGDSSVAVLRILRSLEDGGIVERREAKVDGRSVVVWGLIEKEGG